MTRTLSVVLAGTAGPAGWRRCLAALRRQDHAPLELVVVGGAAAAAAVAEAGLAGRVREVAPGAANLAQARNLGLAAAAGEVVAFLDPAAVPEPTWAGRLAAVFDDPRIEAATGFVRGPDGLRLRHGARWIDAAGRERPLEIETGEVGLHQGAPGAAVKTAPAAMAFRRETLAALGGFDPALPCLRGESDLNMRFAALELITAVVPGAEVLAADPAPSLARARERGASLAVFLRKHQPGGDPAPAFEALRRRARRRFVQAMVAGAIEPRDIARLMAALEAGLAEGLARPVEPLLSVGGPHAPFLPLPEAGPRPARVVAGWLWQHRRLMRIARAHAGTGALVTVLRFSPSAARHRLRFDAGGVWLQTGGLWGPSCEDHPALAVWRPRRRLRAEIARIAAVRPVDTLPG